MNLLLEYGFINLKWVTRYTLFIACFLLNINLLNAQKICDSTCLYSFNGDSISFQSSFLNKRVLFIFLDGASCTGCNMSLYNFLKKNVPKSVNIILIQKYTPSVEYCRMKIAQSKLQFGANYNTYFVKVNENLKSEFKESVAANFLNNFEYYPDVIFYDSNSKKMRTFEYKFIFDNVYISDKFKIELMKLF